MRLTTLLFSLLFPTAVWAQYCASGATSIIDSAIDSVYLAGDVGAIANGSTGICATYTDFSSVQTTVTGGQFYTLDVWAATCGNEYDKYATVWADWNNDLDFDDANEELGQFSGATGIYSVGFTVPLINSGSPVRLRIAMSEGSFPTNACSSYQWGETEDYTLVLPPPPINAALTFLEPVESGCFVGPLLPITIRVANGGSTTIASLDVNYQLSGAPLVTETITGPILSGDTVTHTFTTLADVTTPDYYSLNTWVSLAGDTIPGDDSTAISFLAADVEAVMAINTVAYGAEVSWSIVDSLTGNVVGSGTGYANNNFYTDTLCLLSGVSYTVSAMDSYGDSWNGGTYALTTCNNNVILANNGGNVPDDGVNGGGTFQIESTEQFVATVCPIDGELAGLAGPYSSCVLSATETVTIAVINHGIAPISNVQVSYELNGNGPVNEIIPNAIDGGDTVLYTFTGTIDLSVNGTYSLNTWITVAADTINNNDTLASTIYSGGQDVQVTITTNTWANEIFWQIVDTLSGTIVATGTGYANDSIYYETVCLVPTVGYAFLAWDTYGDGWNGGTYELSTCSGTAFVANNGGNVPNNGATTANEIESTEPFVVPHCPIDDVGITAIPEPATGCGLSASEPITVTIQNYGSNAVSGFSVSYIVDNNTVTETVAATVPAFGTINYTFTQTADLSVPGDYLVIAYTGLAGDTVITNDGTDSNVGSLILIDAFPYTESFETNAGGWTTYGANNSWALGAPSATYISNASHGSKAWVTNLTGPHNINELSYLESPCIDFSSLSQDPVLRFAHTFMTEFCCDEGWAEVSYDGGTSWTKIGYSVSAQNWYNDTADMVWKGSSATPQAWQTALVVLTGAAGEADARVRFVLSADHSQSEEGFGVDAVSLLIPTTNDAGIASVTWPGPDTCSFSGSEHIAVMIENVGLDTLTGVVVEYSVNGGATVSETIAQPIPPVSTFEYTFVSGADFSAPALYDITVWTAVAGDPDHSNDTILYTLNAFLQSEPIVNVGPDTVICPGYPIALSANYASAQYAWSNGGVFETVTVSDTGWYSVTVTNSAGCVGNGSVFLSLAPPPAPELGPEIVLCDGEGVTLDPATDGWDFLWSTGESTATIDVTTAGTYWIEIEQCGFGYDTVTVVVDTCVGIDEPARSQVQLYPVPAHDRVSIAGAEEAANVRLLSASGQLVGQWRWAANPALRELRIGERAAGIYWLSIQTATATSVHRLVVE